ncbi:MAG: pyridoxamine 5'-phosphate oxidase [Leptolyngbya sp. SIO1D8]|nr:pyridoxamine 5'-phosphate oxidase [Leptolyngbya sp. SIO1D8]
MPLAPWRSPLARALHCNRSRVYSRYPQLATVRPNGRPANRTVVFRGFVPETNHLTFVTDIRSDKIQHLQENSAAELCWYFTQTREQFRLGGEVQIITDASSNKAADQIYQQAWEDLSNQAKQQFAWPYPGKPRVIDGFQDIQLETDSPLSTFAVLVLCPDAVDHLELKGEPQNRHQYWLQTDGSWGMLATNP